MTFARDAYAQAPYAGTTLPAPPLGQLPPPIPGGTARYSYGAQIAAWPWAYASWAGGYPQALYPGGGVLADPQPDTGVMALTVWWPDAPALLVARLTPDGTRSPVRGAYPLTTSQATRRNYATNPSVETGLNGYVPDAGTPTLTQLADATAPAGSYVLRATVAGAGSNGVTIPTSLLSPTIGQPVTVGWGMRTSARPTSVTLSIGWTDVGGGALATTTATLTADAINASVNTWARQVLSVLPPAGAVTPTVKIIAGGMPAGGQLDLDAITIETGATDGSAFDGGTLGAVWTGTANLSASILAPLQTVLDGECPLDTTVAYYVSYPGITGGWVQSDPATLPSNGHSWLTHPANPGSPQRINLRRKPKRDFPVLQGTFSPLNRKNKVVVSAAQRNGGEGTIDFNALSKQDRIALLDLLQDVAPLLLRAPADYNYETQWLSLGTLTDDPEDRLAFTDAWLLSLPFTQVDAPSVLA
jgi:hypothetical protein